MASGEKQIHVTVITPARAVFDADARALVAPAFDGELGVLPGHAAFLGLLGTGALRVTRADGKLDCFAVRGGFLQINENNATILTQEAARVDEMDPAKLDAELAEAKAHQALSDEEVAAKERKLAWIEARRKALAAVRAG